MAGEVVTQQVMQAMVADRYGAPDVLELRSVPIPPVGEDEVLVRMVATTVQALDWHYLRGEPLFMRLMVGLRHPKRHIHGREVAGVVEQVGSSVTAFSVGQPVIGWAGSKGGGLAEYTVVPADRLLAAPTRIPLDEAATLGVAAFTALQAVRDRGEVAAGDRVLVIGAASGVGTFAVQLARALGAAHVSGVCGTRNLDLVAGLGVDDVIDRLEEDWRDRPGRWDVIVQVTGDIAWKRTSPRLADGGRYVVVGNNAEGRLLGPGKPIIALTLRSKRDPRIRMLDATENLADLATLIAMVEAGSVRPVIDRSYPLAEAAEAMRHVEEGRASGKVIVRAS